MKWLLILAFLSYDEHVGEYIYSAAQPWTAAYNTRVECLASRDKLINLTLKHQRGDRDGETAAISICVKQHLPVAAALPPGMLQPSQTSPQERYPIGREECPTYGRGTWSENCYYPSKPSSCPDD